MHGHQPPFHHPITRCPNNQLATAHHIRNTYCFGHSRITLSLPVLYLSNHHQIVIHQIEPWPLIRLDQNDQNLYHWTYWGNTRGSHWLWLLFLFAPIPRPFTYHPQRCNSNVWVHERLHRCHFQLKIHFLWIIPYPCISHNFPHHSPYKHRYPILVRILHSKQYKNVFNQLHSCCPYYHHCCSLPFIYLTQLWTKLEQIWFQLHNPNWKYPIMLISIHFLFIIFSLSLHFPKIKSYKQKYFYFYKILLIFKYFAFTKVS